MTDCRLSADELRAWLDRKPPTDVHAWCPVYGDDECAYRYDPAKADGHFCSGAFCLAFARSEFCPTPRRAPRAGSWRDHVRPPCACGPVPAPDGTFGFVWGRCSQCSEEAT